MVIFKKNIWLLFYVILLGCTLFLLVSFYFKYKDIEQNSLTEQKNFLNLVSHSTISLLSTEEMMLDILGNELIKDDSYKYMIKNPEIFDYLLSINPSIVGFGLATPDGNLTFVSSNTDLSMLPNLKNQEASKDSFIHALNSDKMVLGRTYYYTPIKDWVIPIRKAIRDKNGKVLAVMTAGLRIYGKHRIFENVKLDEKSSLNFVRAFDNYIQVRLPKFLKFDVYKEPLSDKLVALFYENARRKYKQLAEELMNNEEILDFKSTNALGKKTHTVMKYNKRYELWIVSQIEIEKIKEEFYKIAFIYIVMFIFTVLILYILFRYIADFEKQRRESLAFQATHDALTSLPNRIYLSKNIKKWINPDAKPFSMLFIDMDNFKNVNDSFGHIFGDKVLVELSKRIDALIDIDSKLIRYGGDEFIVLSAITDNEKLTELTKSIIESLSKPYYIDNLTFILGASIGVAIYPTQEDTLDGLLRASDIAMYEAKKYKNCTRFFADSMKKAYVDNLELEQELKKALEKDEFYLVYQPQCFKDGVVYGVEALLRWHSSKFGNVPPDKFIPIAENIGVMPKIGHFVIQTALMEINHLKKSLGKNFELSINISVKQFLEEDFLEILIREIEKVNFEKDSLTLEITENIFIEDMNHILELLYAIKKMGLKISLDDFGTGYSSLSLLKNLPIDELKIDKSFIDEMIEDRVARKMVENIITIGENLEIRMLAEGVETKEQVELIESLGCNIFQGYYYAKPLNKDKLIDFLNNNLNQI